MVPKNHIATAYSCGELPNEKAKAMNCPNGITSLGTIPTEGRTVACKPSWLGKWINVSGLGNRRCEDTGGAIKGNRIDVYLDTYHEALTYGKRTVNVEEL